jgi:FkbM family methyltransferase
MVILDVGAYDGKPYLQQACNDKSLVVYAFEPNLAIANKVAKTSPDNYHMLPLVVSEIDGTVTFYENVNPHTSSILPFNKEKLPLWHQGHKLKTIKPVEVRSIRLDTFIKQYDITSVDLLKVNAQGADLQVIKSSGDKINIIKKIQLEVCDIDIYKNCNTYDDTIQYLNEHGFELIKTIQYNQYKDLIFKNEKN